ncbi:MAG: GDSL-type esterase/lipase family protein [Acidobacteria bacterium]|nr:GDSL-type esterase/lipase family protein [Acidobacteriota bacterium]
MLKVLLIALFGTGGVSGQGLRPGQDIERSMSQMAASTASNAKTVRVLFYGQSITKQNWWRAVAQDLRARYPHADLRIENRSIGGYSTQYLIRTMEADILPFHPDLILFHDYGSEDVYEKIIRWIRANTTAEILLQSDHVVWLPGEEDPNGSRRKSFDFQERHSFEWLPKLAAKYGLGLVDIRGGWHEHLKQRGISPKELLRDSVHLNAAGEALYAEITKKYLVAPSAGLPGLERELRPKWKGGRLDLEFEGTRVDVVGLQGAALDVLIDGQRPGLFYHSRPTNTWDADWPTVMRVGHEKPLQVEEWVLKVVGRNPPGTEFQFEVYGSVTGFDGAGSSKERFVSRSGRVTLDPTDYDVERSYGLHKIAMPGDWQIRWSTLPQFRDPVRPGDRVQTVAYGLKNGPHRLTLIAPQGSKPNIEKIRIYQPPLKEN